MQGGELTEAANGPWAMSLTHTTGSCQVPGSSAS